MRDENVAAFPFRRCRRDPVRMDLYFVHRIAYLSAMNTQYAGAQPLAYQAEPSARALFIHRTYSHLAAALLVFTGLTGFIVTSPLGESLTRAMLGTSWLLVLALFMGASFIANIWAKSDTSIGLQYLGLGLYIVAEALIFTPILWFANYSYPGVILEAGIVTGMLFLGLTASVFITRSDFSFLGPILTISGFVALGVIICSILFGFSLGTLFSGAMILFAGGAILYDTSNILHHYRTDQHVSASLSLFASVALLFWYVLRLFMALRD